MRYTVNVSSNPEPGKPGGNANFGLQVEADNVLQALEAAQEQLASTIEAAGLKAK